MITAADKAMAEAFCRGAHPAQMDALEYAALVAELQAAPDETRRLELWAAIETIKNRHGARPPQPNPIP